MALISTVGRKHITVRLLILSLYIILMAGAVTMVYPFLLMVTMSTTGNSDVIEYRLMPRYWTSDPFLFKKYILDISPDCMNVSQGNFRNNPNMAELSTWFGKDDWFTPFAVTDKDLAPVLTMDPVKRKAMASDFAFFITNNCSSEYKFPAFLRDASSPYNFRDMYITWLFAKYKTLQGINKAHNQTYQNVNDIAFFPQQQHRRLDTNYTAAKDSITFINSQKPESISLFSADGALYAFMSKTKMPLPASFKPETNIYGKPNLAKLTYDDLMAGRMGPEIKDKFLRGAPTRFLRIDTKKAQASWLQYLKRRGTAYFPLTERLPFVEAQMGVWNVFVASTNYCPLDALSLARPEEEYRPFLIKKYGTLSALNNTYGTKYGSWEDIRLPYAALHAERFVREKSQMRWTYFSYNFLKGFNFIALHGDALMVTLIYIILSIVSTLTVNPMAAYAMSRFRLKESHYILLFLLGTMAFPAEVLMIPNFLSVKAFPLVQILVVAVCALFFIALVINLQKLKIKIPLWLAATVGFAVTLFLAGYLVPNVAKQYDIPLSVTLMNSFWALILPGLASGYSIFLLKGFFDTIPPELYEAGLIDGANEIQLFWNVTLPLSRPIMAVMALNAFTHAYGAFMHAFLTCQDPKMWTLMVFLYEYQMFASVPMLMASLVITSIPTLIVFLMAQKVILEGIVIPTFK
ncbi:MAG: carbohydrate ABC transporter permease [Spirochaetes bacterium]|nr:carbohydrate ABC transporter permease [Spirochaetota bacterium]